MRMGWLVSPSVVNMVVVSDSVEGHILLLPANLGVLIEFSETANI